MIKIPYPQLPSASEGSESRRSDVRPGVIPLATTPAPTAEVASQMLRRAVVHGSIEWTQGLTLEQMLQQKWFVRSKSHDPRHWSYHVLQITDMRPLAKLAADTGST